MVNIFNRRKGLVENMKKRIAVFLLALVSVLLLGVLPVLADGNASEQSGDKLLFSADRESVAREVDGDLLALTNELTVKGAVNGSIRAAAMSMYLNGAVKRNVTVAGQIVEAGENFSARDVVIAGSQVLYTGTCENLSLYGTTVIIGGTVTGKLICNADTVILLESASFQTADISSQHEPVVAKNATDPNYQPYKASAFSERVRFTKLRSEFMDTLMTLPFAAAGTVLLAMFLQLLLKKSSDQLSVQFHERPAPLLLKGLGGLFLLFIAAVFLLASMVATALGLAALLIFILLALVSAAFTAVLLGRLFLAKLNPYLSSALIALAVSVLSVLPFVGSLVQFFCLLVTFGAAWTALFRKKQPPQDIPLGDADFRV